MFANVAGHQVDTSGLYYGHTFGIQDCVEMSAFSYVQYIAIDHTRILLPISALVSEDDRTLSW